MSRRTVIFSFLFLFMTPLSLHGDMDTNNRPISVCYDFGCKRQGRIDLNESEIDTLRQLFENNTSPQEEREKISTAIAILEQISGRRLGTSNDKARNIAAGEPMQMDCIDESKNTTTYLNLLKDNGWIKWHSVQKRAKRNPFFFDTHWSAVIKDDNSGQLFVVDSWFRQNGEEPIIITLEEWMSKNENP